MAITTSTARCSADLMLVDLLRGSAGRILEQKSSKDVASEQSRTAWVRLKVFEQI